MYIKRSILALVAVLLPLYVACSASDSGNAPPQGSLQTGGAEEGSTPGAGGSTSTAGGTGGFIVDEGVGLTSPVFGSLEDLLAVGGGGPVACDYGDTPTCDFSRLDGCCAHVSCAHASDANPDDPYPIEFCQTLLACVQNENPGCSTAADPLCLGNETGPCLDNSHADPNGPFPHVLELINCVCGY